MIRRKNATSNNPSIWYVAVTNINTSTQPSPGLKRVFYLIGQQFSRRGSGVAFLLRLALFVPTVFVSTSYEVDVGKLVVKNRVARNDSSTIKGTQVTAQSKELSYWLTTHPIREGKKPSRLPAALGIATQKVTCAMDDQQTYNAVISRRCGSPAF